MTPSEIQTLDQNKMVDTTSGEQADNVFEGLTRIDNHGNVKPAVATKSVPSKDGKTWTFTLRKNARWSNGDPVTADDFVLKGLPNSSFTFLLSLDLPSILIA